MNFKNKISKILALTFVGSGIFFYYCGKLPKESSRTSSDQPQPQPQPKPKPSTIYAAVNKPNEPSYIVYSKNLGKSWEFLTKNDLAPGGDIFGIFVKSINLVYAATTGYTGKLLEIKDNGNTQIELFNGMNCFSVFVSPTAINLASDDQVYYSTDNGTNWTATQTPDNSTVFSVFVTPSGTLYAGTRNENVLYSTDNGSSWTATQKPDGSIVYSIFVTPSGTLYAGTEKGNVLYSTDNGSNWTATQKPDNSFVYSVFVTPSGTLYAGTRNGNILYSTDNGSSWTATQTKPMEGYNVKSIYVAEEQ